jgi:aspartyl-tRNA(Asn)/glutamyl-tRNA(Gln) amidotransferase subunit C
MSISQDQVRHVAKLARLNLKDEEVEKFAGQLSNIFDYVDLLNEVDVDGVEPTSQVTGLENVTRPDEVVQFCDPKDLLACSPLPIENDQIKVKSVF